MPLVMQGLQFWQLGEEHLAGRGPELGVLLQEVPDELLELRRVVAPDGGELAAHDLVDEGGQVGALEGLLQARHLVDDAAERPDVRLFVVDLALAHFGTGCGNDGQNVSTQGQKMRDIRNNNICNALLFGNYSLVYVL